VLLVAAFAPSRLVGAGRVGHAVGGGRQVRDGVVSHEMGLGERRVRSNVCVGGVRGRAGMLKRAVWLQVGVVVVVGETGAMGVEYI
jgi:hypothetical protein